MEIINTRRFHHPREKVFDAFAEPEQLAHGWGPDGFTNTIERFELRSGGAWHVTMHALGGAAYPNESEFVEVVRPARIVLVHVRPLHRFEMTMTYSEVEDGTELTWHMRLDPHPENAKWQGFIREANDQNLARLEAHLAVRTVSG